MSSVFVRRKFGQADTTALIHVLCMGVWGLINVLLEQSSLEAASSLHYRTQNKERIERDSLKNPSAWGNMNSMKLVISLHSLYWSIHTKDESKRGTAFAFIFGVNWLLRCCVTASFGVFFDKFQGIQDHDCLLYITHFDWCIHHTLYQSKTTL